MVVFLLTTNDSSIHAEETERKARTQVSGQQVMVASPSALAVDQLLACWPGLGASKAGLKVENGRIRLQERRAMCRWIVWLVSRYGQLSLG